MYVRTYVCIYIYIYITVYVKEYGRVTHSFPDIRSPSDSSLEFKVQTEENSAWNTHVTGYLLKVGVTNYALSKRNNPGKP
jgi:hypothetical protein